MTWVGFEDGKAGLRKLGLHPTPRPVALLRPHERQLHSARQRNTTRAGCHHIRFLSSVETEAHEADAAGVQHDFLDRAVGEDPRARSVSARQVAVVPAWLLVLRI